MLLRQHSPPLAKHGTTTAPFFRNCPQMLWHTSKPPNLKSSPRTSYTTRDLLASPIPCFRRAGKCLVSLDHGGWGYLKRDEHDW